MPSSYTAPVQDGKITEFKDFAILCARAFGACIEMRDEPLDTPIPEAFSPRTKYYDDYLQNAREKLAALKAMSAAEIGSTHSAAVKKWHEDAAVYLKEKQEHRARYQAMLVKVEAWEPPADDMVEFRQFMRKQLQESLDFDCPNHYWADQLPENPQAWHTAQIEKAQWDIDYYTKNREEEIRKTEGRNKWIATLRQSLEAAAMTAQQEG